MVFCYYITNNLFSVIGGFDTFADAIGNKSSWYFLHFHAHLLGTCETDFMKKNGSNRCNTRFESIDPPIFQKKRTNAQYDRSDAECRCRDDHEGITSGSCFFDASDDEGEITPGFRVLDFPYYCRPRTHPDLKPRSPVRILLPVLSVRSADGTVLVPDEPFNWARHLAEDGRPASEIRRRLNSVGRLHEFIETIAPERILQPGAMDLLVWEYLRSRLETPVDPGARQFEHWQPVQYEVVRTEFRDLVDYGRYCTMYTGPTSVMGAAFKAGGEIWLKTNRALSQERLLAHLEAQRARWHALLGDDRPAAPSKLKKLAATLGKKTSSSDTTLSIDAVDSLIDRERNPMLQALWIELAYAGPRVSETLNHWRCDVLNASHSKVLFNAPVDGPLLIFADPVMSTYTGGFSKGSAVKTRKQVLKERYGLVPRPDEAGRKQRAGWKGMAVFNPDLRITHGTWTCRKHAERFAELHAEILDLHGSLKSDAMHPFLFVNSRNAAYIGEPLKIGNVEESFERACVRVGIKPHSHGANLHGLRHYYRWYASRYLELSDEIVQLMMRQKSVSSQRVYGKRAQDAHDAMANLYKKKEELQP